MILSAEERRRLAALQQLQMLDTGVEERFERITRMAAHVFHAPIVLISLVDADRQWFKSCHGLSLHQTPREHSICSWAIQQDATFIVPDARLDSRFADNPLVIGEPHIRFYAGHPLHSLRGEKLGTLCVIDREPRDFTGSDQRCLQDLAAWAERELNDLAAQRALREGLISNLGHELRTPLTAVLGSLGLIHEGGEGQTAAEIEPYLELALNNGRRLGLLLGELLEAERLSRSEIEFSPEPLALLPFLEGLRPGFQAEAQRRQCQLRLLVEDCRVLADRDHLATALGCLVSNACKFTAKGSCVQISATQRAGELELAVQDQGPGVADDVRPRLFQAFSQSAAAQFGKQGGMGLGLYLCRMLVEGMGGRLNYQDAVEGGSRFYISIPLMRD